MGVSSRLTFCLLATGPKAGFAKWTQSPSELSKEKVEVCQPQTKRYGGREKAKHPKLKSTWKEPE